MISKSLTSLISRFLDKYRVCSKIVVGELAESVEKMECSLFVFQILKINSFFSEEFFFWNTCLVNNKPKSGRLQC